MANTNDKIIAEFSIEDIEIESSSYDNNVDEECERLYQKAPESRKDYDEYAMYVINSLTPFIAKTANYIMSENVSCGNYGDYGPISKEDLVQAGKIAIIESLKEYCPSQARMTTFFYNRIRAKMFEQKRMSLNNSEHFSKQIAKLAKAAIELGYSDFRECPASKLAEYTQLSIKTVIDSLASCTNVSNIDDVEEFSISTTEQVDAELLKVEETDKLLTCLNKLTPYQRLLVTAYNGVTYSNGVLETTENNSFKRIRLLAQNLGYEISSVTTLQRDYSEAIRKLRILMLHGESFSKPKDLGLTSYKQAEDEELITMFEIL